MGVVVSDMAAACPGGLPFVCCATIVWSEHAWRVVPLEGTTGDVYEAGFGMPPLHGALGLLHYRSF